MIGLIIIVVGLFYLLLWIAVVFFSYRLTFEMSNSKTVASIVASMICLLMYFIPFADLIPTLTAHKHHCETQAGFTVYKTPEQWAAENPGVLETLTPYKKFVPLDLPIGSGTQKNDRFGLVFKESDIDTLPLNEHRSILIDIKTQEVLAENVDFSRGYGAIGLGRKGWWKFWLAEDSCYIGSKRVQYFEKRRNFYQGFKFRGSY